MSGLNTYHQSNRPTSALVGYAIMQAGAQSYLNNTTVAAATNVDDLIASVNAAIVAPGAEAAGQRASIVAALREGLRLGDLGDSRVQGATSPLTLAELTWITDDPRYATHLGPNLVP